MLPVQAGTDAAYRTVVQIQYRRQQQMELVERNGGVNFAFEIEAAATIGVDLGGEDAIATTAILLGLVHCHVGMPQQTFAVAFIQRVERHADRKSTRLNSSH